MNNNIVNTSTRYAIYDIHQARHFKGVWDDGILIGVAWVDNPIDCTHFDTLEKALDYTKTLKGRNHELVLCVCKLNLTCEMILNF